MSKIKYERHRREYTILGITSVVEAMTGAILNEAYGGTFVELPSVVKEGVYFHFQAIGDRERVSTLFLNKVKNGQVNLVTSFDWFDAEVSRYEEVIYQDDANFSLDTFLDFYRWYQELFPIAYAGMDSADFVGVLPKEIQQAYIDWATKIRRRGEVIYKDGEMKFIPRYTAWLAKNKLPAYTGEELCYLLGRELAAYITTGAVLPSPAMLRERKRALYVRQYAIGQVELAAGDQALRIIEEQKLLASPGDELEGLSELKGQTAFPGLVTGYVRVVRARQDMENFKDGEIIVSQMTDPSYLPIMKRAAAFVTNEGGLLCHAAIVARELQKPCIIGTKHATHVFKDGELVEVDAATGTIRKLTPA